jgi:hypothetical protein
MLGKILNIDGKIFIIIQMVNKLLGSLNLKKSGLLNMAFHQLMAQLTSQIYFLITSLLMAEIQSFPQVKLISLLSVKQLKEQYLLGKIMHSLKINFYGAGMPDHIPIGQDLVIYGVMDINGVKVIG